MEPLDYKLWGRRRLVLLQVGYVFLTMKSERISESIRDLIDGMELFSLIGSTSMKIASAEERPGLMLAERLYGYVLAQDERAYDQAKSARDERAYVFRDPLVHSRYASSLFLQERFGQAKTALDHLLFSEDSWGMNRYENLGRFDVSIYELFMRHSQYTFLRYYSQDDKIIDNLKTLIRGFVPVIEGIDKNDSESDEKRFRAICWYLMCSMYIETLNIVKPAFLVVNDDEVRGYLKKNFREPIAERLKSKPEVICGRYLLMESLDQESAWGMDRVSEELAQHDSYPGVVLSCFADMLMRVGGHVNAGKSARPKLFISYSHADKSVADELIAGFGDGGIEVLSDKQFIVGDSLLDGMQRAIKNAEVCAILVTSHYLKSSGWLAKEREAIFARNVAGECDIIVLAYGVSVEEIRIAQPMMANTIVVSLDSSSLALEIYKVGVQIQAIAGRRRKTVRAPRSRR